MLTQTVTITQNSNPNIIIGRRSTYETQQVIFDVSWLVQTYGEGTAELLIKRPKDASAYPVVATLDGNTLTWTVSETDTQDKGHGECEIYWYVNGGLAKSCICGITILRDIGDTTETAPDPYETWVDELARLGSETLANAQAAEQSANNAAQSASEADNSAAAALESEENALNSENAAKASEQAAAASEQGAEQSATEAAQSASAAESSAANAQESADNSSASADRAEQAAASIEGDTERAEAAARTAQGASSDASRFAGTASTKATEAAGSAATAEQAATTATQKAADASASATAAVDSASSASASATAAGNAQTAAETAQGKAEDAQEAAETAAQSIEDSAAQIDQNAEDILNLKSAINAKAGIIRDTISGSVASFVPDSTIDNLLGLSVALEPIQDLHGYDSPWPAGGGKNLLNYADASVATNSTSFNSGIQLAANQAYTFSYYGADNVTIIGYVHGTSTRVFTSGYTKVYTFTPAENVSIDVNYYNSTGVTSAENLFQLEAGGASSSFSPYSNICPISGRDSVEVEAAGVNLFDKAKTTHLYCDGTMTLRENSDMLSVFVELVQGATYTFTQTSVGAFTRYAVCDSLEVAAPFYNPRNGTARYYITDPQFTFTANRKYLVCTIYRASADVGKTFDDFADTCQLTVGSAVPTATSYEPYQGNRYTIQLGDTVYGGTLDVTTGKLTVDRAMVDMGTLSWIYDDTIYPDWAFFRALITDKKSGWNNGIMEQYKITSWQYARTEDFVFTCAPYHSWQNVIIRDSRYIDATVFKQAVTGQKYVYKLATPITIQLDPVTISTIAGQTNNVWADAGDVTVEYAADLKTYIDNKIAAAVAAMS